MSVEVSVEPVRDEGYVIREKKTGLVLFGGKRFADRRASLRFLLEANRQVGAVKWVAGPEATAARKRQLPLFA